MTYIEDLFYTFDCAELQLFIRPRVRADYHLLPQFPKESLEKLGNLGLLIPQTSFYTLQGLVKLAATGNKGGSIDTSLLLSVCSVQLTWRGRYLGI